MRLILRTIVSIFLLLSGSALSTPWLGPFALPTAAAASLSALGIQRLDLRSGYVRDVATYFTASQVATHYSGVTARSLNAHGFIAGYQVGFERSTNSVNDTILQFRSTLGASWFYQTTLGTVAPGGQYAAYPVSVGNQSVGIRGCCVGSPNTLAVVHFRRGRYVVDLDVSNASAQIASSSAVALAQLVDRRILGHG